MDLLLIFKRDLKAFFASLELVKSLAKCFKSLRLFFSDLLGDQDYDTLLYQLGHGIAWLLTFVLGIGICLLAMGVFYQKNECVQASLFMLTAPILFILGCYLAYQVSK